MSPTSPQGRSHRSLIPPLMLSHALLRGSPLPYRPLVSHEPGTYDHLHYTYVLTGCFSVCFQHLTAPRPPLQTVARHRNILAIASWLFFWCSLAMRVCVFMNQNNASNHLRGPGSVWRGVCVEVSCFLPMFPMINLHQVAIATRK